MSFDFNPGAWLKASPLPELPMPCPSPWRQQWAAQIREKAVAKASECWAILVGRAGRGADIARTMLSRAESNLETSWEKKDVIGLRESAATIGCVRDAIPNRLGDFHDESAKNEIGSAAPETVRTGPPRKKIVHAVERDGPTPAALF